MALDHPERVERLLTTPAFRLERIVSEGHASPPGFWYDQPQHEWVALLAGAAKLRFEDRDELVEMKPGDFVCLAYGAGNRDEIATLVCSQRFRQVCLKHKLKIGFWPVRVDEQ